MRSNALRCTFLLAAVVLVFSALAWADTVEICHVPPGNPDNSHTIIVDANNVAAHLGHGDHLGSCEGGNACDPNPCVHGTCQSGGGSYTCTCESGWQGTNCDEDIDECAAIPNPCPPEAPTCTNHPGSYSCGGY